MLLVHALLAAFVFELFSEVFVWRGDRKGSYC